MAKIGDTVEVEKITKFLELEREKAWRDVNAQPGDLDWEVAAGKIHVINNISNMLHHSNAAARSSADQAAVPILRSGESIVHYDYADGSAKTELQKWAAWTCPKCDAFVGEQFIPSWATPSGAKAEPHNQNKCNFCPRCGQRIDWEKVETEK